MKQLQKPHPFSFRVSSLSASVKVSTDSRNARDYFKGFFAEESIPGYKFEDPAAKEGGCELVYRTRGHHLRFQRTKVDVALPESQLHFPDLIYLALVLLEKQHALEGRSTVHGAAFSRGHHSALLLGDPGNGKTTVLLNLFLQGYGVLSNDKSVVGYGNEHPSVLAGTNYLSVRPAVYSALAPETRSALEALRRGTSEKGKVILDPRQGGSELGDNQLSALFFLNILDGSDTVIFKPLERDMATLFLVKEMSTYLRGVSSAALSFDRQFPSFDTAQTAEKRMDLVRSIVETTRVFVLRANLPNILQIIGEVFESH